MANSEALMDEQLLAQAGNVLFPYLRALAHDMAGPVTSALGYSQLTLQMMPPGSEFHEDIQEIETSAQQLREQVASMGRLSRFVPEEQQSSAQELTCDLEQLARAMGRRNGLEIIFESQGSGSVEVWGNPWLLRAGCLALVGEALERKLTRFSAHLSASGLRLSFPLLPTNGASPGYGARPDRSGSLALGRAVLESQRAVLSGDVDLQVFLAAAES